MKIKKKFNIEPLNIVLLLLIIGVVIISSLILLNKTDNLDTIVLLFISSKRHPYLTRFMIFVSEFANTSFLIVAVLFLLQLVEKKDYKYLILINSLGVLLLNLFIKLLFGRLRPELFMLLPKTSYSYPSGHAMVGTAFYGLLAYLCYKNIRHNYWHYVAPILLVLLSLLISFSRLYLGVHYLTDIMTGIMIGVIILIVEIKILKRK